MSGTRLSPPKGSVTNKIHHEPYPVISPNRKELSAASKHVVVTGGGSGIGKAIAMSFAEAGATSISIIGRRSEVLTDARASIVQSAAARGHKPTVLVAQADLSDWEQTVRAFSTVTSQVGKADVVVANAGTLPRMGLVTELDIPDLMGGFSINVGSILHTLKAAHSFASLNAVIININTKMHSFPHFGPKMSTYSTTKAAGLALTDFFAEENPSFHVVNVHPGVVSTDMTGYGEDSRKYYFVLWKESLSSDKEN